MCSVNGCDRQPKAKGLCAMHYQRLKRTSDPEKVRRAGRRTDPILDNLRQEFSRDWSPRTITRYKRALAMFWAAGCVEEEVEDLSAAARFANGKPNVARLERLARAKFFVALKQGRLEQVTKRQGRTFVRKR